MSAAPVVIVMAAGQGTRMKSKTPKVLHDLLGRPMGLWPVHAALEAGAQKVVVVDGPGRPLEDVLPEGAVEVVQPEANGTGGAIQAAAEQIEPQAPVVVLSGDVPLVTADAIRELVASHEGQVTMATTKLEDPTGYGRVVRRDDGTVGKVVETKKDGDATPEELAIDEVNTGIYIFDGAFLLDALPKLTADNAQGELYLPQVLDHASTVNAHVVDDPNLVRGINDRAALAEVRAIAQRRLLDDLMREGTTVIDPANTYVDVTVTVGRDTTLEPGTVLRGATSVGDDCRIGPHVVAIDSTIEDGVSVGPFAYLRPGTHLRAGSKIGTFVEVKNSDIGARTKVPHLSYIGDADVGEDGNLGAATITANYDAKSKSKRRTTIGDRVKSSVDVTFVAPVKIGDDAYTAAGSVITDDVPPKALGVARERQRNVEGYADRPSKEQ
ncbi:MAG TPA: bifunctional UDP-N-acetylglucosamine diphosphorylase/glucosamine-1-phosphate N-acetyltransferase GlmU [Thermoleophilaceae bacterium]|nr:bifunctional UDP-N-acetylglucosamine diphosphorylase/glucosamine-1-phosphate N-acetyltransferase GlmU [Thermoleophilaceae bacterium]